MRLWKRPTHDDRAFGDALADCLETADSPDGIALSLRRYPQYAERLEPLLVTAQATRRGLAAPIREERRALARRQFLQAAAQQSRAAPSYVAGRVPGASRAPAVVLRPLWSTFAPAIVAAALFVVALVPILALTSSSALPGDWNYGFKRSTERVRLALALDPADRFNLQVAFHQRRVREVERLASTGRYDPSLLQQLNSETEALLTTVSTSRALGPSEAEKVVQVTDVQAQVLQNQIEPRAPAAIRKDVAVVVAQSQQIQQQAAQVVEAKREEVVASPPASAKARTQSPPPTAGATQAAGTRSTATAKPGETPSATASPSATPSAPETATPSVVIVAVQPNSTPSPSPIVPPSQTPIIVPPAPPSPPARSATPPVAEAAPTSSEGLVRVPSLPAAVSAPASPASLSTPEQTLAQTPVPTPEPTHTPLPTPPPPPPTPTPLVVPLQPPPSAQQARVALPAGGQSFFVYNGPEIALSDALASIAGQYEVVYITQPSNSGGHVIPYYPGTTDPRTELQPGSYVTIVTKPGIPPILAFPTGGQ